MAGLKPGSFKASQLEYDPKTGKSRFRGQKSELPDGRTVSAEELAKRRESEKKQIARRLYSKELDELTDEEKKKVDEIPGENETVRELINDIENREVENKPRLESDLEKANRILRTYKPKDYELSSFMDEEGIKALEKKKTKDSEK